MVYKKFSGRELRKLRKAAKFTQKTLADRIGVSRETVVAIENDHTGTIDTIKAQVIAEWKYACFKGESFMPIKKAFEDYLMKYFKWNKFKGFFVF